MKCLDIGLSAGRELYQMGREAIDANLEITNLKIRHEANRNSI